MAFMADCDRLRCGSTHDSVTELCISHDGDGTCVENVDVQAMAPQLVTQRRLDISASSPHSNRDPHPAVPCNTPPTTEVTGGPAPGKTGYGRDRASPPPSRP